MGFPGTDKLPLAGGKPETILLRESFANILVTDNEHKALKTLAEISTGIENFTHVYNFEGWCYNVSRGVNFRVIHPRHDGSVWMLWVLYDPGDGIKGAVI